CQMIEVPAQMPRRPSSQVTSVPSRLQVWANAGIANAGSSRIAVRSSNDARLIVMAASFISGSRSASALADPKNQNITAMCLGLDDITALRDEMRNVDRCQRVGAFDHHHISRL